VIVHLVASWITASSQTQLYRFRSDGQSIETVKLGPDEVPVFAAGQRKS
jgi:hypothetical protein